MTAKRLRSKLRLLGPLFVLVLVAAACTGSSEGAQGEGSDGASRTPGDSSDTGGESGEDSDGGGGEPLTIALGNMPPSGVPWTGVGTPGQYVWSGVFDALTVIDESGEPAPALASSWESIDETTWRFELREGVEFHNGETLDAEAVKATYDLLLSEEGSSKYSAHTRNYSGITGIEVVDDMTVEINTESPSPLLPNKVSIVYIVPPEYFEEEGAESFATAPVGTGPYEVATWNPDTIRMERADSSWRDEASVETIEYVLISDSAPRVQALQSGQVDNIVSPSPDQFDQLESEGFTGYTASAGRLMSLTFVSNEGGPLANQKVRQALNYAVDKQAIAEELVAGLTQPTAWPPQGVNGYDESREPYPYDPERARQLLEEAGYGDGFDINAEVTVGSFPADREIYEAAAGYLSDIGVNVTLNEIDFNSEWLPKFTGSGGADWSGNAFGSTWNAPPVLDAIRPFEWQSCGWSNEWFCDQQAEELVNEVNSTFDREQRNDVLNQLLDRNMEDPPALFLIELVDFWMHSPDLEGWKVNAFNPSYSELEFSP
jgi:peptide/nickel transport system substrate-binding protein